MIKNSDNRYDADETMDITMMMMMIDNDNCNDNDSNHNNNNDNDKDSYKDKDKIMIAVARYVLPRCCWHCQKVWRTISRGTLHTVSS